MARGWLVVLLALPGAAPGCGDAPRQPALELLAFRQRDLHTVALNEELLFHFSADLDRGSITSDSVRILDEQGHEVAGEREVRGSTLSFLPALPCASDLSDGGLRPGGSYRVALGGFPRPDGIRSQSGALLSATLLLTFETADIGGPGPLFLDPFLGPFPLVPRSDRLEEGTIVLVCGEALDPSSVPRSKFEVRRILPADSEEKIPLEAHLIVNRRDHAELLLLPRGDPGVAGGRLAPDRYFLSARESELRTLGGRTVEPGWPQSKPLTVAQARVEVGLRPPRERSSALPPGCSGTALWSEERGLHVRYPAAAGDGQAGAVELTEHPLVSDVQATALTLAAGEEVDLSALTGPVVLRSQTSIEIRGRLRRDGEGQQDDPPTRELENAEKLPDGERGALSAWVEAVLDPLRSGPEPWTVLIAGGDIRVPKGGAIEVEGPLLLVAGGWLRLEGKVVAQDDLWKTPEGVAMAYSDGGRLRTLPLVLDPPLVNPLRTPLCVGLVTAPFSWSPRADGWSFHLVGSEGAGRASAELVSSVDPGPSSGPGSSSGAVRAHVRLEIGPGRLEPWDPPRIARLKLEASPRRVRDEPRN